MRSHRFFDDRYDGRADLEWQRPDLSAERRDASGEPVGGVRAEHRSRAVGGLTLGQERQQDAPPVGDPHRVAAWLAGRLTDDAAVDVRSVGFDQAGVATGLLFADDAEPERDRRFRVRLGDSAHDDPHGAGHPSRPDGP